VSALIWYQPSCLCWWFPTHKQQLSVPRIIPQIKACFVEEHWQNSMNLYPRSMLQMVTLSLRGDNVCIYYLDNIIHSKL
jgi:hypothetical protein